MKKKIRFLITVLLPVLYASAISGQEITISGSVKNKNTNEGIPAVSIVAKGLRGGTYTNENGNFHLTLKGSFPVTLEISSVGFEPQEIVVQSGKEPVVTSLQQVNTLEPPVVVGPDK